MDHILMRGDGEAVRRVQSMGEKSKRPGQSQKNHIFGFGGRQKEADRMPRGKKLEENKEKGRVKEFSRSLLV